MGQSHRTLFTTKFCVRDIWLKLGLPNDALKHLKLLGRDGIAASSSFKVGHLAQSSIASSGLVAALIYAHRHAGDVPNVTVSREHAVIEFHSEQLYQLDNKKSKPPWGTIGGIHETADGHVRVHDSFPHHHEAALKLVGCGPTASKQEFVQALKSHRAEAVEDAAVNTGAVIFRLRSFAEWDQTPQAEAVPGFPIKLTKIANSEPHSPIASSKKEKCLSGIRVLELSRVIAAPVAGRTLAAHGADVLWITSPNLPSLPALDIDTSRGKRTAHLDLNDDKDLDRVLELMVDADVVLQSYRPGSLAKRGLSLNHIQQRRKNQRPLVWANLSAWGDEGPWANRRGFDSIVQTASGMNVSEAEHYGNGAKALPMPCQALDHGAGHLLATGIMAALYKQMTEGGSYQVDVSLAGVMNYLRSLGQYEERSGFEHKLYKDITDVPTDMRETRNCAFGKLEAIKHSVQIDGVEVGWEEMPKPLGSDEAVWLPR